jgi:hypothetical protein
MFADVSSARYSCESGIVSQLTKVNAIVDDARARLERGVRSGKMVNTIA